MAVLPPSNALSFIANLTKDAFKACWSRRVDEGRAILMAELRAGNLPLPDVHKDELLSCMARFDRSVVEGAAHYKLRLLAKVLRGQIEGGCLVADEFLVLADMIASLRESEIKLLGALYRVEEAAPDTWQRASGSLGKLLVPKVFSSEVELEASACAVLRTGLLLQASGRDGVMSFRPSPLLRSLVDIAGLEALEI